MSEWCVCTAAKQWRVLLLPNAAVAAGKPQHLLLHGIPRVRVFEFLLSALHQGLLNLLMSCPGTALAMLVEIQFRWMWVCVPPNGCARVFDGRVSGCCCFGKLISCHLGMFAVGEDIDCMVYSPGFVLK